MWGGRKVSRSGGMHTEMTSSHQGCYMTVLWFGGKICGQIGLNPVCSKTRESPHDVPDEMTSLPCDVIMSGLYYHDILVSGFPLPVNWPKQGHPCPDLLNDIPNTIMGDLASLFSSFEKHSSLKKTNMNLPTLLWWVKSRFQGCREVLGIPGQEIVLFSSGPVPEVVST